MARSLCLIHHMITDFLHFGTTVQTLLFLKYSNFIRFQKVRLHFEVGEAKNFIESHAEFSLNKKWFQPSRNYFSAEKPASIWSMLSLISEVSRLLIRVSNLLENGLCKTNKIYQQTFPSSNLNLLSWEVRWSADCEVSHSTVGSNNQQFSKKAERMAHH